MDINLIEIRNSKRRKRKLISRMEKFLSALFKIVHEIF